MAVKKIKIGNTEFTFVFRHKYEKELSLLDKMVEWREYKLGFFYKSFEMVGRKNFKKPSEWKNNMVRQHMLGINLLVAKAWFTVNTGGMSLGKD